MTLDEIEAFVCIAELGGFTKASERLNRSQPAISRRIALLEAALGAPLFERVGRGVALTSAGRALLPHAEAALAAMRDGAKAVRGIGARADDTLTLAIVGTLADAHVVGTLRKFQERFRQARIELRTATSREVSDLVRRGDADLGLRYWPDNDRRLEVRPLGAERLFVVVPAGHRVRAKRVKDIHVFAADRWLGFPVSRGQPESFGRMLETQLIAAGLTEPSITAVDSLTAQKRLVEAGFGISLMPLSSIREELRIGSLRIVEVAGMKPECPVMLVQRRGGYRGATVEALVELLRADTPRLLNAAP